MLILALVFMMTIYSVHSWTPIPVVDDRNVFMPGSQPGEAGQSETPDKCDNCHGGYNITVEPAYNWRGSMMAQAARDPLWLACLTTSLQDSIWAVGNPNAGDICIRCHSPTGWLEGRSDPTNTAGLATSDFDGVQCDFCHRMIDPFAELSQPDVPPELSSSQSSANLTEVGIIGTFISTYPWILLFPFFAATIVVSRSKSARKGWIVISSALLLASTVIPAIVASQSMADETYLRDIEVLSTLTLFDGTPFLDATNLPTYYGDGSLPNYVENAAGQFFVDPGNAKRGPFDDAAAKHQVYYSRYHKSEKFCASCHDVSNPILASVLLGQDIPETQAAASYFHVERTFSEFMLSEYGRNGSEADILDVLWADKCQDCHMRDVVGLGCNKAGTPTRSDLPLHDLTGGNQWLSRILATVDPENIGYDPYNYAILSGQKYEGAQIEVAGIVGQGQALWDGGERANMQLRVAANLSTVEETADNITIRVKNNAGHKLISGFPEGRRMFLNVQFYNASDILIGEVNPYEPLVTTTDGEGNEVYVSGGDLVKTHERLVWEAEMSSVDLTGEEKTFHFALGTDRYKDNRIPPKGFNTTEMYARLAQPRWEGLDAPAYFTPEEYVGGYDDVTVEKPSGTAYWYTTLCYQTTSKDYVEFLRDEINGIGNTLSSPTPSGEPNAYVVQTDPFFANLKGWGNAIWDLWLHNGGAEPITMSTVGSQRPPTGDANGDGIVDILDLNMVGYAFGAREGERRYNPDLDFNQDGRIDMREIIVIAQNFGKTL
ncbi:MAG: hypothetical protein JSW53_01110 [Candidatus Bathyarchaeota archaeon]|nr:MAG: hypothetical protein JSW53_01110 [Candidatus Bathyarchaeota archaeon]